jgi:hypothetical protein
MYKTSCVKITTDRRIGPMPFLFVSSLELDRRLAKLLVQLFIREARNSSVVKALCYTLEDGGIETR